jgi:hypothetical protein
VASSCKPNDKHSGFIKVGKFVDCLNDYQLVKYYSAQYSYFLLLYRP